MNNQKTRGHTYEAAQVHATVKQQPESSLAELRRALRVASPANCGEGAQRSIFEILVERFGLTMSLDEFTHVFFRGRCRKTIMNKASQGLLPLRVGGVFDTRDVAEWYSQRLTNALQLRGVSTHPLCTN